MARITEEQYILSRTTRWDRIKTNLFFLPATVFALGILYFMFFSVSEEMSRGFFGIVLLLGLPSVILNMMGAAKVRKLKKQYNDYKDYKLNGGK